LRKQEAYWDIRERYAKIYDGAFKEFSDIRRQPRPDGELDRHALHLYILRIDPAAYTVCRNQIVEALLAENVGAAIHYRALHTHPYYSERFGYQLVPSNTALPSWRNLVSRLCLPACPCTSSGY
jgi:UDP-4-amino-4-deoxy-L-arabinose-oxoglutarate aminotransferase